MKRPDTFQESINRLSRSWYAFKATLLKPIFTGLEKFYRWLKNK